jgi:hypothetical protein
VDDPKRREARAKVKAALHRYRGGHFVVNGSGGAGGMIFFVDHHGREWYIGGMQGEHAEGVVAALNALLDLMETRHGG